MHDYMKLIGIFLGGRNLYFFAYFQEFTYLFMISEGDVVGEEVVSGVNKVLGKQLT